MSERDIFITVLEQPDPAERAAILDRAWGIVRAIKTLETINGKSAEELWKSVEPK